MRSARSASRVVVELAEEGDEDGWCGWGLWPLWPSLMAVVERALMEVMPELGVPLGKGGVSLGAGGRGGGGRGRTACLMGLRGRRGEGEGL